MMLGIANGIKPFRDRPRIRTGRPALFGSALAILAGCGYQLAGAGRLPAAMQTTYLDSSEPRSEFYASMSEALRRRGLLLVDSRGEAGARLIISEDSTGQRVLSVTARNIPREYEIFYSVIFSLEAEGEPLIQAEALVARRNYTYDETAVLGKEREESLLRRALAEDLARQVMRRIEALSRTAPPG